MFGHRQEWHDCSFMSDQNVVLIHILHLTLLTDSQVEIFLTQRFHEVKSGRKARHRCSSLLYDGLEGVPTLGSDRFLLQLIRFYFVQVFVIRLVLAKFGVLRGKKINFLTLHRELS